MAYLDAEVAMSDIYIVVGYKHSIIEEYIYSKYPDVNIVVNTDYDVTNNMFSLNLCLQTIKDESIVVSNGDCVYDHKIISKLIINSINYTWS